MHDTKYSVSVLRRLDSTYVVSAAGIVLYVVSALLIVYRLSPPQPVTNNQPLTEFSAERALKHLAVIAQRPHPVGTSEHEAVGNYIQNELVATGLTPEVQRTETVTNILVRLKGTSDQKAVMLVGHYDTVPPSPGASDDGAAVASILETLRALKSSQQLRNDVIALFSDGEELGSLGARAFARNHPWTKDVGVVFNFDARGTSGPVIMFETSNNNRRLIKEFAKAAPHAAANSLAPAIYELMRNKTDMTVFKEEGLAGLNFGFIAGLNHYHTESDNLMNLDHNSLQHQGTTALALTRHFGNLSLTNDSNENAVYFDVLNSVVISYSERWVVPLAVLVGLSFVVLVVFGFKNKHLTGEGLALSFLVFPLTVISSVLIMFPIGELLTKFNSTKNLLLFIFVTICVVLIINAMLSRKVGIPNLLTGSYLWSLILLVLTSLFLKGGSYLFTWPLLFNLGALGLVLARKDRGILPIKHLVLLLVCGIPGIILFSPLVYLTSVALTLRSFIALFAIAGVMVLLLGPLTPHFAVVAGIRRR